MEPEFQYGQPQPEHAVQWQQCAVCQVIKQKIFNYLDSVAVRAPRFSASERSAQDDSPKARFPRVEQDSGSEVAENCFTSFITPKLREVFIRQSIKIKVQKNNA